MDWFDVMLEEKLLEEIKEQKRQELLAKLTPEERELLNLN
jgi:Mg/Co/Ni transporter MgtE